jgi:hypothetical protein
MMGTAYSEIYNMFEEKINDYDIAKLISDGYQSTVDAMYLSYLKTAISKFKAYSKSDLADRNDTTLVFTETLTDTEIDILSLLMVLEWIRPLINRVTLLKQALNNTDFRQFSQQAHLKELINLKKNTKEEIDGLIVEFTYVENDIETVLKPN